MNPIRLRKMARKERAIIEKEAMIRAKRTHLLLKFEQNICHQYSYPSSKISRAIDSHQWDCILR